MKVTDLKGQGFYAPFAEIPPLVVEENKCRLADTLLAMIAGVLVTPADEIAKMREVIKEEPGVRPVWPERNEVSEEASGFLNGFFIRYSDWGDSYRRRCGIGVGGHPSDLFAGILAICASENVSGKEIIELSHLGYQMWSIIQENMLYKDENLDYTTGLGLIMAVLAAVHDGASPERIQNVLNLSASSAVVLEQVRPGDITNLKSGATAYATARAIWCYRFSNFLQAPASMFEGKHGWYHGVAELTGDFIMPENYSAYETVQTKTFPAFNQAQAPAPVECAIAIHNKLKDSGKKIAGVTLRICEKDAKKVLREGQVQYPSNMAEGDHHMKYCVAVALYSGALTPLQYSDEYLNSPEVHEIIDKIEVVKMSEEERAALGKAKSGMCMLEVTTTDGEVLKENCAKPMGVLTDMDPEEKIQKLQAIVNMKRTMLEQTGGYDFSTLFDKVARLEDINGLELVDLIRETIKNL